MRTSIFWSGVAIVLLAGCSKQDDDDKAKPRETRAVTAPAAEAPPPAVRSELSFDAAAVARGGTLVDANCARCHARVPGEVSKHASAPSFATLFVNYPPEYLEEAFAEGVFVGHADMPAFEFSPQQIADLIAYLKTLGPNQNN